MQHSDEKFIGIINDFIKGQLQKFPVPHLEAKPSPYWAKLAQMGTKLWLDTGDIDEALKMWCTEFSALTTNNSLINKEVQKGIYDSLIKDAADVLSRTLSPMKEDELILEIGFILNAIHAMRLAEIFKCNVSVELHTNVADDIEKTVYYAERYFSLNPRFFYIKVPLTPAGYLAARKLRKKNIPVNFTLGFSARQNYVAALLSDPSFVNVFMGRINALTIDYKIGNGKNVGEKAVIATQREIRSLRKENKSHSLLIGASMRDGSQIAALAGLDVFTMPPKVADEYIKKFSQTVIEDRTAINPMVELGSETAVFSVLWNVSTTFKDCVEKLLSKNLDEMVTDNFISHFETSGFGDFLPRWDVNAVRTIAADGKIPVYDKWRNELRSGKIGLDALLNKAGLLSFADDQKSLDNRIKSIL